METTTFRVSEPCEMLAYLPHQLGFQPSESAVVVSLRPRGRIGLVARVDLPDVADVLDGPRLARGLVAHLGADGATGAVLVLYTCADPRVPGEAATAARAAAEHVREAACAALGEVAVWVVTATGYLALDCDDDDCCPSGGRPLRELQSTALGAQMVLAGSSVACTREDVARIPPAGADARRAVARVAARWRARGEQAATAGPGPLDAWRRAALVVWRSEVASAVAGSSGAGAPALGRLEVALTDTRVRDAVLVSLVPGTADLPERSLEGEVADTADALGRAVALIVDQRCGTQPDAAQARAHAAVLERVVAHGRHREQAPALALLALLAWWQADGARASILVGRALDDDPGHRLAHILDGTLAAAMPPGWVRRAR